MTGGDTLGAVIAGGRSTRFGSPKALARIGPDRVVDRVVSALRHALPEADLVGIINDADLAREIGLPHRADVLRDAGALAGVHAALLWARERGRTGVFATGCDMPFLDPALIRVIAGRAEDDVDAVLPSSPGRRGVEPLCAWYSIRCIPAIEDAVARGDARMIGFLDAVRAVLVPLDEVRAFGDPERLFMNLNTPSDLERAMRTVEP